MLVGATFQIPKQHKLDAKRVADKLSPNIATLREVNPAESYGVYGECPNSLWLEIKWSSVTPTRMIKTQSCNILWYPSADPVDEQVPIAFGIEDLEYFTKEADYDLSMPTGFSLPSMKIGFQND